MKTEIEKAFAGLSEYAAALVSHPNHSILIRRAIDKCQKEVMSAANVQSAEPEPEPARSAAKPEGGKKAGNG